MNASLHMKSVDNEFYCEKEKECRRSLYRTSIFPRRDGIGQLQYVHGRAYQRPHIQASTSTSYAWRPPYYYLRIAVHTE